METLVRILGAFTLWATFAASYALQVIIYIEGVKVLVDRLQNPWVILLALGSLVIAIGISIFYIRKGS